MFSAVSDRGGETLAANQLLARAKVSLSLNTHLIFRKVTNNTLNDIVTTLKTVLQFYWGF